MILSLFRKPPSPIPAKLYAAVVMAARRPPFYLDYGVPDTAQGRFELVIVHACLLLRHSRNHTELQGLAQDFIDVLFKELDRALREMGVGDMSVPKRMKKLASAVYGRFSAYDEAFAQRDRSILAQALARNISFSAEESSGSKLADYVAAADAALAKTFTPDLFLSGEIAYLTLMPA